MAKNVSAILCHETDYFLNIVPGMWIKYIIYGIQNHRFL